MEDFRDNSLLITGGTGSFGRTMVRGLLKRGFSEIRIFSRDEKKQEELRKAHADDRLAFYIGDVRDYDSVEEAVDGVDFIFHAAALKQVPSCEFFPLEAVKTNVLGSQNVIRAALAHRVQSLVMLSTDKAVYPINAMGLTKAMMEKLVLAYSRHKQGGKCVISATRYGNVMGSRGSVIPLFIDQIMAGRPLTVTDPQMTRFLMSLEESIDLVNFAFKNSERGDIFVQKSPATTIGIIAEALLQIFNASNPIKVIGVRHSEKHYETLATREELEKAEDCGLYYRIPSDRRSLNYEAYYSVGERMKVDLDYHSHNTHQLGLSETVKLLKSLQCVKVALQGKPAEDLY